MSEKPEALRLADALDVGEISYTGMCKAAAELRRLHAVNAKDGVCEALECCKQAAQEQFCDGHCTWRDHHPACVRAEEPQRTLTDEVIANLWHQNGGFHHHFARNIERWIKGQA